MIEPIVEEINLSKLSLLELEGLKRQLDSLIWREQLRRYQAQEFKVGDVVVKRINKLSCKQIGQAKIIEIKQSPYAFSESFKVVYVIEVIKEDQYPFYPSLQPLGDVFEMNQGAFHSNFVKAELVEEEILEHGLNIAYEPGGPLNHAYEGGRFPL